MSGSDPWPFNVNPPPPAHPLPAPGAGAITLDFTGLANGASWDSIGMFVTSTRTGSELLVRFKPVSLGRDRRLRFWLRADVGMRRPHRSIATLLRSALPATPVRIIRTRNGNGVAALTTFSHARSLDWQWLRFRVEGDQLSVRFWDDGDVEQPVAFSATFAGAANGVSWDPPACSRRPSVLLRQLQTRCTQERRDLLMVHKPPKTSRSSAIQRTRRAA